jgi:hypothetical protein
MRKSSAVLILVLVLVSCVAAVATAGAKPGSGTKPAAAPGAGPDLQGATKSYPECSPYLSETAAVFCRFNRMHVWFDNACSFSSQNGNCAGRADSGSFPWGTSGSAKDPYVLVSWRPAGSGDGRRVTFKSYGPTYSQIPRAELVGYVSGSGSGDLHVESAIAGNDQGFPNGDEYYTLDLPGRATGNPGGPLYINWESHGIKRSEVTVEGYLYLFGR